MCFTASLLGGQHRQESAQGSCWGGNPASRCAKQNKAGRPKPKRFRQRFGYFAAEGKVTRSGERNIPIKKRKAASFDAAFLN